MMAYDVIDILLVKRYLLWVCDKNTILGLS